MKILILGNSNIFNRKIFPALDKFKKINIELATRRKNYNGHKISKIYKNYSEALKKTKAKIVYISLINSKHYFWGIRALNKNKHVIIDKPLTLNYKDSLKLLNCAKKKKLLIAESTVFHFHEQFNKIQSLIDLKKKISIKTFFHIPKLNIDNYRTNINLGGGCFNDMSTYGGYLINFFFNKDYNIKIKKKHFIKKNFSHGFNIIVKNKNILLNSSFKFNSKYKNIMIIENCKYKYIFEYVFSPPIDKNLVLKKINKINKKEKLIYFNKENVFYNFFKKIFKKIKLNNFIQFNNELMITEKIRNEIS